MRHRLLTRSIAASLLALAGSGLGCGDRSPVAPQPPPATGVSIVDITPTTGPARGGTTVRIRGAGFQTGAIVRLDGMLANGSVVGSTSIVVTTPARSEGPVDVVVTNPDGQSGRLAGGYTYAADAPLPPLPPPAATAVRPDVGSTGGGTPLQIVGTGFQSGATVTIGDMPTTAYASYTTIFLVAPAHSAGSVDVIVTNPDGGTLRLSGGYTYALPSSFDFNGTWEGEADVPVTHQAYGFAMKVQDGFVTSVSCNAATLILSPPARVANGEFSFAGEDGLAVAGRIVAHGLTLGTIDTPACKATAWWAERR